MSNLNRPSGRGLTLARLLWEFRESGVLEGSGGFTLDPEIAQRKLANFQLPLPQAYAVKVVQFAFATGAQNIRIDDRLGRLEVEFDGKALQSTDLDRLLVFLLDHNLDRNFHHFRHLSSALCGATALRPNTIVFRHTHNGQGFRKRWSAKGWKRETFRSSGPTQSKFLLIRSLPQKLARLTTGLGESLGLVEQPEKETEVVARLCRFFPGRIWLNDEPLAPASFGFSDPNKSSFPADKLVAGLYHKYQHLVEKFVANEDNSRASLPHPRDPDSGLCRAYVGIRAALSNRSEVVYIDDGVVLCTKSFELDCPGFFCVFSAEQLSKDISGFELVSDTRFQAHMDWLHGQAKELCAQLLEFSKSQPEPIQRRIEKSLARMESNQL